MYPLVLKCKLQQAGFYKLTSQDLVDIVGLDLLLKDRPFFRMAGPIKAEADSAAPAEPAAGEPDMGGWLQRMEVLGRAWASYELSRYVGEACDEVTEP